VDVVSGRVEVDLGYGQDKLIYEAVVKRGDVDNITTLRRIWITDWGYEGQMG
jgi:hypothetical protein